MNRAAVLGSPVAHSLSPVLHTAGYAACGLPDWSYVAREVTAGQLAEVVDSLDGSWRGLSLTMPLKEAAFAVAASVSEVAQRSGAVNTLVRREGGGWDATNTDVAGIVEALRHTAPRRDGPDRESWGCLVIGAGATARSAVLAARELGYAEVQVTARREEAAAGVAELAAGLGVESEVVPLDRWAQDLPAVVISTVPADASPGLAAALAGADATGSTLLDVVYAGWPTPLARAFTEADGAVVSGIEMLIHQAAAQFTLFTGVPAPVEAMADAGRAALVRT